MQSDPVGLEGGENSFVYVGDNPLVRVDERGEFWDTVADVGFIAYDLISAGYHYVTGDNEAFKTDMAALAADSAAAMVPFATGAGLGVRAGMKIVSFTVKGLPFLLKKIWGKTADEIAEAFIEKGYSVDIKQSTRGSGKATLIYIPDHPNISLIEVHPGGGKHGGAYYRISTTQQGKIKVVDKHTYIPGKDEKAKIFYYQDLQ